MKVYAKHEKIQTYLKEKNSDLFSVVDTLEECHYYISGRFSSNDYHENLRGVIIPYTGHNGIDLDLMREKNLQLYVTPTRSRYVAEKAVSLLLALTGKVIQYHNLLLDGKWADRNGESRIPWNSIQGKTIGLYGYGRIGKIVHEMLKGFGCDFYTIDRDNEYPNDMNTVKNLTNLVQISDVIIISTPLNDTTISSFDHQKLNRMKNKFLVNVGRGKIVEEEALYNSLKNGRLKGYASDVWYNYPSEKEDCLPSAYPIHEFDNVVLSNHSGGYTYNTNKEVNEDIFNLLKKISGDDFTDKLELDKLL